MDFFKFTPQSITDATILEKGEQINGLIRTMWVERYTEPGEFSFEAKLSSGLREFLPLGTIISHADTLEIMIVENHEIVEATEEDPSLVITGRSFVSFLENRVVGVISARSNSSVNTYTLFANYTWDQAVKIINDHIVTASADDTLTNVIADTLLPSSGGSSNARTIEFGTVWDRVVELLKVDDLGIKTIRRNTFGVVGSSTQTVIRVYKGVDRSASVIFSWKGGDLSSSNYLFSNKSDKNSALVLGTYVVAVVDIGPTKYGRRFMMVDGKDIDGHLDVAPTGATLTAIINYLQIRGYQALAAQNQITIGQTDLSKTAKYRYRRDYDIGDLISLDGNFGQIQVMRVVEYAEIEDENGESGHPTLAIPGG